LLFRNCSLLDTPEVFAMAMASSIEVKLAEYRRQKANTYQQVGS